MTSMLTRWFPDDYNLTKKHVKKDFVVQKGYSDQDDANRLIANCNGDRSQSTIHFTYDLIGYEKVCLKFIVIYYFRVPRVTRKIDSE